jgi:hypothetical protein
MDFGNYGESGMFLGWLPIEKEVGRIRSTAFFAVCRVKMKKKRLVLA